MHPKLMPPARLARPLASAPLAAVAKLALIACCTWLAAVAAANAATPASATPASAKSETNPNTPIPVAPSEIPYPGRHLSSDQALRIAEALPLVRRERARYPGAYGGAYLKGPGRWQVSFFSRRAQEIVQVYIADATGRVLEQWSGFQVAWTMARGYPGAFGRHVNALYIWLPLCLLFFAPFFNWRRPFSLLHLDLLVLLGFSVSLAFFNHANIGLSVPLAYPPLLYLLARMLALARPLRRAPPGPGAGLRLPHPSWLALGVVFLIGFRVALNVTDSNVIDVGFAGVIGAQRIVDGRALYGGYPTDNEHGDTYGPVNYASYVPFQQILGWSGKWDDLPAAHGAAILFDLLAVALLFLLGRRVRGPTLGLALAYAWVSYPFTLYALESNANDTLVCVLVLAALLCATSAPARGVFAALAGLTKFAPLALAPLLATHGLRGESMVTAPRLAEPRLATPRPAELRLARLRALSAFALTFALTVALVSIPALRHDSLHTIYERTIAYQANRGSPFSVWGLYGGLGAEQLIVEALAVALAVALALVPRRPDVIGLAAAAAAILIALQLGIEHWFYLYIPWFFPFVMLTLLGRVTDPEPALGPTEGLGLEERLSPREPSAPPADLIPAPGAASESALLSRPAAEPSNGLARPSARDPLLRSQSAPASA
jgi:hypothetical protein